MDRSRNDLQNYLKAFFNARKSSSEFSSSFEKHVTRQEAFEREIRRPEKRAWKVKFWLKIPGLLSSGISFKKTWKGYSENFNTKWGTKTAPHNDNRKLRPNRTLGFLKAAAALIITAPVTVPLIVYPTTAYAMHVYFGYVPTPDSVKKVIEDGECHTRSIVMNGENFQGSLPASNKSSDCEGVKLRHISGQTKARYLPFITPHIETLEGDILGGAGLGSDPMAMARSFYNYAFQDRLMGGSTPLQSSVGSLYGHATVAGNFSKAIAKLFEMKAAAAMTASLSREDIEKFVATHWQCAVGAPGSRYGISTGGIALCSQLLFRVPPSQLTDAQSCILAATFFRPFFSGSYHSEDSLRIAQDRWSRLKDRSRVCAQKLPSRSPTERAHIENEIDEMAMPRPDREASERGLHVNPAHRSLNALGFDQGLSLSEIKARAGRSYQQRIEIDLSNFSLKAS